MNYVMTAAHLHIQGKFIPAGTIIPVEDANGFWRVVSGPYEGIKVAGFHCTTFPLYQEVLQLREEVAALTKHNEYLVKRVESQDKAIFKWEKAWEKERDEKRMLQEEINKIVAQEKVEIPREVAEAIEQVRDKGWRNYDVIRCIFHQVVSRYERQMKSIRKYGENFDSFDKLISALVFGYTIEQTAAERIKRGIQDIYEKWTSCPSKDDDQADGADLAERISNFVLSELKM
ncbi:DUF1642 domain-containing protein [Brevibacillus sp. B_LB10_24]|uniref:DUF1642 domain-containing protein n=1 Tax=Brevibacillus sp. B_LB10_24 TaxID=3380645 RepID=UPI0038B81A6D